jgi:ISXO2-like transposase domain
MQGVEEAILGYVRDDLRESEIADPRLPRRHRDLLQRGQGKSMLALSRDLGVQYKTAFVLAHKIREAIGATVEAESELTGEVEVDGAYLCGHVKQENRKADRRDRRLAEERTGRRQVVVIIRERNGRAVRWLSIGRAQQSRRSALGSLLARSSTPTNRQPGTYCATPMTRGE